MSYIIQDISNIENDVTFEGNVTFEGGTLFGNVYNTPVFTSDQTDLLILDIEKRTIITFNCSNNIEIDSIVAPHTPDDQTVTEQLYCFTNGTINKSVKFKRTSSSQTPENHFFMDADIEIKEGEFWWFKYSHILKRWNAQAKI